MKGKLILLFALALLLALPAAFADVLFPGEKSVGYCFEISNIGEYPGYAFVASFYGANGGYNVAEEGECVGFYKFDRATVYAIKKEKFDEIDFTDVEKLEKIKEEGYFEKNKDFVPSGIEIHHGQSTVAETDPLEKTVDVLEIVSLSETGFNLKKSKVIYAYLGGFVEEKVYTSQDERPPRSLGAILPAWFTAFWVITFPITALIIIGLILLYRRRKK